MKNVNYLIVDCGNSSCDFFGINLSINLSVFCKVRNSSFLDMDLTDFLEYLSKQVEVDFIEEIYISSVNSKILDKFKKLKHVHINVLDRKIMQSFCLKHNYTFDNLDILGSDLFADCIAVSSSLNSSSSNYQNNRLKLDENEEKEPKGVIICDLGTATKVLCMKDDVFAGGVIFPGISSCSKMLSDSTDLLAEYDLLDVNKTLYLDTQSAINSGAINGTYNMIKGLVEQIKVEENIPSSKVYLTGGNSSFILKSYSDKERFPFIYDQFLTLKGIAKAFELEFSDNCITHININELHFKRK